MDEDKKKYAEDMDGCPSQQGFRCSMNGELCSKENCTPRFMFRKIRDEWIKEDQLHVVVNQEVLTTLVDQLRDEVNPDRDRSKEDA